MLVAVVLAAGGSTRFGAPKQLHEVGGEPLVRRAARAALAAGAGSVIVVTGSGADRVEACVTGIPGVATARNPGWALGIGSSLATGLRALPVGYDAVLITLADQPLVDAAALGRLLAAFGRRRIAAASHSGIIGVPVVVGAELVGELLTLPPHTGAGRWLRQRAGDVAAVPMEEAAFDIDSPEDARRLQLPTA